MHLLADLCINASAREAGSAAKVAAVHKTAKYQGLDRMYIFQPLEVNLWAHSTTKVALFWSISTVSSDDQDSTRASSVLIQRHNSILLRQSF